MSAKFTHSFRKNFGRVVVPPHSLQRVSEGPHKSFWALDILVTESPQLLSYPFHWKVEIRNLHQNHGDSFCARARFREVIWEAPPKIAQHFHFHFQPKCRLTCKCSQLFKITSVHRYTDQQSDQSLNLNLQVSSIRGKISSGWHLLQVQHFQQKCRLTCKCSQLLSCQSLWAIFWSGVTHLIMVDSPEQIVL